MFQSKTIKNVDYVTQRNARLEDNFFVETFLVSGKNWKEKYHIFVFKKLEETVENKWEISSKPIYIEEFTKNIKASSGRKYRIEGLTVSRSTIFSFWPR